MKDFVNYYLDILLKAYNEFESRVAYLKHRSLSKPFFKDNAVFVILCIV